MKKGLLLTTGMAGAALLAAVLIKNLNKDAVMKEKTIDENYADERKNTDEKSEVKKTQNREDKMVNVSNSLVSINIKIFSK